MMIPILLFVTATFTPAAPAIGDRITINYSQPVTVQPSAEYEIVSRKPSQVIVRTFETHPITVHATAASGEPAADVVIAVRSVLAPNDALRPAPLKPPRTLAPSPVPWIAIAIAAVIALLVCLAVCLRSKRMKSSALAPQVPPDERFRLALQAAARSRLRWAALADATRTYLASTHPELGLELTTEELLRSDAMPAPLQTILRHGDLEKFAPWGAQPGDFDAALNSALSLVAAKQVIGGEP